MNRFALVRRQENNLLAVVLPPCPTARANLVKSLGEIRVARKDEMALEARNRDKRRAVVPTDRPRVVVCPCAPVFPVDYLLEQLSRKRRVIGIFVLEEGKDSIRG